MAVPADVVGKRLRDLEANDAVLALEQLAKLRRGEDPRVPRPHSVVRTAHEAKAVSPSFVRRFALPSG